MRVLKNPSIEGELLKEEQICKLSNLGRCKVREIAKEAGAVRKIGKCYRINKQRFFDYIEKIYTA